MADRVIKCLISEMEQDDISSVDGCLAGSDEYIPLHRSVFIFSYSVLKKIVFISVTYSKLELTTKRKTACKPKVRVRMSHLIAN